VKRRLSVPVALQYAYGVLSALRCRRALIAAVVASSACASAEPQGEPFDTSPVAVESTSSALDDSWRLGPFMEIYVRAYRDSNGDGEGDLEGVIEKLDYLEALGVRGLWLMPITASQDNDHGYMVTDYRAIHPDYGSIESLDALLAAAHARGIGVIMDYVVNHSAKQHPGFVAAAASASSTWRDWYVWSPSHMAGWSSVSNEDPWRPSPAAAGWYYASFIADMPDFNWKNPEVAAYHQSSFRYWLNRGVDGFRIDAAQLLVENGPLAVADQPETLTALAGLRGVVDGYANRFMVCEAPGAPRSYAIGNVCGGAFGFATSGHATPTGEARGQQMVLAALGDPVSTSAVAQSPYSAPIGKLSTLLANHDRFAGQRLWNTFGGDTPGYRLAAATLMLMPGIPFLYYGEEIGMAEIALADPLTDYHQRGAMSWTADPGNAGFSSLPQLDGPRAVSDPAYKYLKPAPNVATANVAAETADPGSLLSHYRALIALRNAHAALSRGSYRLLASDGASMVFSRGHADEEVIVAINYQRTGALIAVQGIAGGAAYAPLFAYGTAPATLTADASGTASLAMPAQSVQVFGLARRSTPFGVDMYVRGSMNDWADPPPPSARLVYDGDTSYDLTLHLTAGDYIFKIAPADWSAMLNFGAVGGRTLVIGSPLALEQTGWRDGGSGADLRLNAPRDGDYRFSIDATNVLAPRVTVAHVP
jgi:glycosidase